MTRSRRRKLARSAATRDHSRTVIKAASLVSILSAGISLATAQDPQAGGVKDQQSESTQEQQNASTLQEVIVTAQKRAQNLQNVPVSVTALTSEKLAQLNIQSFNDYANYFPSVSFVTIGPGQSQVFIRGVSSGIQPSRAGPLPTVGTYLDDQPLTTIQGTIDAHIYDVQRIEVLAGPQGTLYGASSEAGAIRIITNTPDPNRFSAGYDLEGNMVSHGGNGGVAQGFVNIPLWSRAALRLVGWHEHDAGYIDNVPGTRTFPSSGICIANTNPPPAGCVSTPAQAQRNFNAIDTDGGRAALKVDLDENWTITPMVMAQRTNTNGNFGYNPALGDLKVKDYYPVSYRDSFVDAALTIEGKISNFDLVYTGAFLNRTVSTQNDYSDYALAYDSYFGTFISDNSGNAINPSQTKFNEDHYKRYSHELRIVSPADARLRFVGGLFVQRQQDDVYDLWQINGLAQSLWTTSPAGLPADVWSLNIENRIDHDKAVFGELSYDLIPKKLTLTVGDRYFKSENYQIGEVGYGAFFGFAEPSFDADTRGTGNTPKATITYHVDDHRMVYATYSTGYRPGGINRRPTQSPYKADYLKNYEIGWKTSWFDNRLRFNGAVFQENWDKYQFSFQGTNGASEFANAGFARIRGMESDVAWAASDRFTVTGGITWIDPIITENYCGKVDANGNPITNCPSPKAPAGTQLPNVPKVKGNVTGRYVFHLADFAAYLQGTFVYQTSTWNDLRLKERGRLGENPAYGVADFSAGIAKGDRTLELIVNNAFDRRGIVSRMAGCSINSCAPIAVYAIPIEPRMVGIKFGESF